VIPWLEANTAKTPEQERRCGGCAGSLVHHGVRPGRLQPRVVRANGEEADRHSELSQVSGRRWRREEFRTHSVTLAGGEIVNLQLAERGSQLSNKLWLREIRKLTDSGHQTSILTTNFQAPMTTLACRYSPDGVRKTSSVTCGNTIVLDRLMSMESRSFLIRFVWLNPVWRTLDSQIRSKAGQRHRRAAEFGAMILSEDPATPRWRVFSGARDNCEKGFRLSIWKLGNLNKSARNPRITFGEVIARGRPVHSPCARK